MDKPISLVLSIALAVAGMIAVGFIMWTQITNAQGDIENFNPFSGITTQVVCNAAGGTWDASATGDKCT